MKHPCTLQIKHIFTLHMTTIYTTCETSIHTKNITYETSFYTTYETTIHTTYKTSIYTKNEILMHSETSIHTTNKLILLLSTCKHPITLHTKHSLYITYEIIIHATCTTFIYNIVCEMCSFTLQMKRLFTLHMKVHSYSNETFNQHCMQNLTYIIFTHIRVDCDSQHMKLYG